MGDSRNDNERNKTKVLNILEKVRREDREMRTAAGSKK